MKITFYGHACVKIELSNKTLLFDPFISANPLASMVDINTIKADYILVSHGHQDHIADAVQIANNNGATVVSNFEIINWFAKQGIENGHPMNIGGKWKFDFGTVTFFNAVHSSVLPDGTYGGNPGSFFVETDEGNFYFAGDTALFYDLKLIGDYKKMLFAILPIGDNFTMGVDDAVIAADFIKCDIILAMHYDTFPYIEIDKNIAKKKFSDNNKDLIFIDINDSIEL